MDTTTKNYIVWIDDLSKNYPSIRLEFFATSTEEALQKTKTWLKENAAYLRDYTMKIVDDLTRQLLLKAEIHEPSAEAKNPAEKFFQQSGKPRTFYVTIYHPDGSRFTSLEYKAEIPEQAFEKAKVYMAREWDGIENYRAVVKEKQNRQVLLDRVVSQESGPTDEEKALEDERFQAFMRDWKAISSNLTEEAEVRKESLSNFFEAETSIEYRVRIYEYDFQRAIPDRCKAIRRVKAKTPSEAADRAKKWIQDNLLSGIYYWLNVSEWHDPFETSLFTTVFDNVEDMNEAESPDATDEAETSIKDYCAVIIVPRKYNIRYWVEAVSPEHALELAKVYVANETEIREDYTANVYDTFEHGPVLEREIHYLSNEAETLDDISNATDLYHAANDLIQISKQLTEVASQLLSMK